MLKPSELKLKVVIVLVILGGLSSAEIALRDPFCQNEDKFLPTKTAESKKTSTGLVVGSCSGKEEVFIYNLNYRDPVSLVKIVKELYPEVVVSAEPESKQLIIKTQRSKFQVLAEKIKSLDSELSQILIEVKVVEVSNGELERLGLIWDFGADGLALAQRQQTAEYIKKLDLLCGEGRAKIMANPRVATILGKEAVIHIGDQVPYAVPKEFASGKITWEINYIAAGINLIILPQKAEGDSILLKLVPEVSAIKQWMLTPNGEYPILSSRRVETCLKINNGQSFVIGGLLNEEEHDTLQKVPILGDIPFLNILFTNKTKENSKSDVLFIVTAKKV